MPPVQRVNVDFAQDMLRELDLAARELNVSRQAVIKIFVRQALNQHYLAQRARHEKTSSKRAQFCRKPQQKIGARECCVSRKHFRILPELK